MADMMFKFHHILNKYTITDLNVLNNIYAILLEKEYLLKISKI